MKNKALKIRILTYHNVPNNGAVLQALSVVRLLSKIPNADVKIYDYTHPYIRMNELVKLFKFYPKTPFFNLRRKILFKKFINNNLPLSRALGGVSLKSLENSINRDNPDLVVVGSDNIWRITDRCPNPSFPNIYWPSPAVKAKKISLSASAYGSEKKAVKYNRDLIRGILNEFRYLSVRDDFSYNLICEETNKYVDRLPDPTFYIDIPKTCVKEKLNRMGIDLDRPTVGILIYNNDPLSKGIYDYYSQKGYGILALSMYNQFADYNLGHLLDPFEWAEVFKYLKVVVTDRFHGCIFCLKNKTPFVAIEPGKSRNYENGKIYCLMKEFDLLHNYFYPYKNGFAPIDLLRRCDESMTKWKGREISKQNTTMKNRLISFVKKIGEL